MKEKEEEKEKPLFKPVSTIIRLLIFSYVIYKIYFEAGPWTAFFASVMYITTELQSVLNLIQARATKDLIDILIRKFSLYEKLFKHKTTEEMVEEEIIRRTKEN